MGHDQLWDYTQHRRSFKFQRAILLTQVVDSLGELLQRSQTTGGAEPKQEDSDIEMHSLCPCYDETKEEIQDNSGRTKQDLHCLTGKVGQTVFEFQ